MENDNWIAPPEIEQLRQQSEYQEFEGTSSLMELAALSVIVLATLMSGFGMSVLLGTLI